MTYDCCCETELGLFVITCDCEAVVACTRVREQRASDDSPLAVRAARELREYLAGKRTAFSIPLRPAGTAFQQKVWQTLQGIPYGEVRTYGDIARHLGSPKLARAVGNACGRNPIWVMIPCHRVIGSDGRLGGYAGGLDLKQSLLSLERNKNTCR